MSSNFDVLVGYEPEFVCTVQDESIGLVGHVVVDASIAGHACGGLRLSNTVGINELKALARSMTLKYGYNHMAQGGAKAGIVADPDLPLERRRSLLYRFGQLIAPLLRGGYYFSGPDMNTTEDDVEHMLNGAGVHLPSPRKGKGQKSGLYTAMGVMVAAEAAASFMQTTLEGKTVAIEGFGAVGSALAMLMVRKKKAKVVAVSTTKGAIYDPRGLDVERLLKLRERYGNDAVNEYKEADRIENEDLLLLDVDVLSPCARQFAITAKNACRVRAPLICPGANNPATPEALEILFQRKIPAIPHFVANGGGVLGNKIEVLGLGEDFIESFMRRRNFPRIVSLMRRSQETDEPMIAIARREAREAFSAMQEKAGRPGMRSRAHDAGLRVFNSGLIPGFIVRPLAPLYLKRTMTVPAD